MNLQQLHGLSLFYNAAQEEIVYRRIPFLKTWEDLEDIMGSEFGGGV